MTPFTNEALFEQAVIRHLSTKGWEMEVIKNPTEEDLLNNWANILFQNNREIDRLNDTPLTKGEMQQILEQITALRSPLKLNGFINGKSAAITRDNPADVLHFGKEVSLKIYDRLEIAAGQSRYQIVQQPKYKSKSKILNDRRGDLILLINGMPVIHLELKRSGIHISQASTQIEKYAYEGVFTGIFSLIQIFVAMTPEETLYFANPGSEGKFNKDYFFHWADFNNEPINDWRQISNSLISIPMAHQLIGFYTVPDNSEGVLKVMRSYQYYAANAISDRVAKTDWKNPDVRGGYIWHTTGSGKTMTSFKSAQLIANSKDADKVVFLMDRIELGTQSLREYRGFADDNQSVQATEDTYVLVSKLKSSDPADTLIVTSIQKMSNIGAEEDGLNAKDLEQMRSKRMVIIIDEAHRTVFGENMLPAIRETFPRAVLFGFTGTPIQEENQRKEATTSTIFGNELHRYSLADGIRDKNVLGFDPYKVLTYKDKDIRKAVALQEAKAATEAEAITDPNKSNIYYRFMDSAKVFMAGGLNEAGQYVKGIEDYLNRSQYERIEHQSTVVADIKDNWLRLSHNGKFHAILATSSITEAIEYYRLLKAEFSTLKTTALFDPNIDNNEGFIFKEEGLLELMEDYNQRYQQDFTFASHARFKKDISNRLAHKKPYERIEKSPEKQIDILIVVDQMLTGFDSKWVNTLYLDKVLRYENIIQAFSRTNRLFGPEKPFGVVKYYRLPHTMHQNVDRAVKLYSGDRPYGLFVEHLDKQLENMNFVYQQIEDLFTNEGIENFEKLPDDLAVRGQFAKLFKVFNQYLEAAKVQGFQWIKPIYDFKDRKPKLVIVMLVDETNYNSLLARYKEMFTTTGAGGGSLPDVPFEIEPYIVEIDTGKIDADYMNSRFVKYIKSLDQTDISEEQRKLILDELHKSFATLTQEEQKFANIFLNDVMSGNVKLAADKTFRDYITEYLYRAKYGQILKLSSLLGLDKDKLQKLMRENITELNINEYGRFDELKATVDRDKAKAYFEKIEGKTLPNFRISIKIDQLLKDFIGKDGFELVE
jgi:type I restriction enzyme R subunit